VSSKNVHLVQQVYAAFGRADINGVLEAMAPDVEFTFPDSPVIPYAGAYRGPDGIAQFLMTLGEAVDIAQFVPDEFIAQGDDVVALGHERVTAKSTGRVFHANWAMVWSVRNGKIARIREYTDTDAIAGAFRP